MVTFRHTVRALGIMLLLVGAIVPASLIAMPATAVQENSPWWDVRTIKTAKLGLPGPLGLAFSTTANAFLVPTAPAGGSEAASSELALISPSEEALGAVHLDAAIADPGNAAFDHRANRLLYFDAAAEELVQVGADSTGRPMRGAGATRRFSVGGAEVREPRGMTVDPESGRLYVLDARQPRILTITPDSAGSLDLAQARRDGRMEELHLTGLAVGQMRGLAFNPANGHLYVLGLGPSRQLLYELAQDGQLVASRDLTALKLRDPRGMLFAPSGDTTDDPAAMHLYIADRGQQVGPRRAQMLGGQAGPLQLVDVGAQVGAEQQTVGAGIHELALVEPLAASGPEATASLVQIIEAWQWNPPAPDPAGVAWWPAAQRLVVADSEVDEMPIFQGKNVFLSTTGGTLTDTCSTLIFSSEPTGVSVNRHNNHIFFSDDAERRIFELHLGPDGAYCTADDTLTSFSTTAFGSSDPEDVAYGRVDGRDKLFISDGLNREVYIVDPGPNGIFDGVAPAGDDTVTSFDTAVIGLRDPEGIGFDHNTSTLYIVSRKVSDGLVEVTVSGSVLRVAELSFLDIISPSGVDLAPGSQNPQLTNVYVAARGVDNGQDPMENDGKVYELTLSEAGPTATATPTSWITLSFAAAADAYVDEANPSMNFGSSSQLLVDGLPNQHAYLRFDVTGVAGPVQSAKLMLYAVNGASDGPGIYSTDSGWSELGITWDNKPSAQTQSDNLGPIDVGDWATFDVTPLVAAGDGTYSFVLIPDSTNGVEFYSRTGAAPPQLVVTFDSGVTPTPTATQTQIGSATPTQIATQTATSTASPTETPTSTATATHTATKTPTVTATPTPTQAAWRITSPSSGANITSCPLTIQAAANGASKVQFFGLYDSKWHDLGTDTNGADGWSTSWNCGGLSNQQVILTTWVWDSGNNLIMDPGGYVDVSLNLPTPHITSPQNGQTITSTPVTIQLSGGNFSKVQFFGLYDGRWNDLGTDTNGADGWSTSWNVGTTNQTVRLTTWAWDTGGNLIMDPGGYVDVSLNLPTPHITSPQNGQTITSTPVTIQLSGGNFSKVQFFGLYDGRWNDLGTDTNGADGWSTSWNVGTTNQTVRLTTWAWDTGGNLIMDPGGYVDVSLNLPTPHITSPQNGQTITSTPVTIQLSGGNFSKVQFFGLYDGRWNDLGTDTNGADGWSTSWNVGTTNQTVRLTTWAWDTGGNLIMDPGGYVDVTLNLPTPHITSPQNGQTITSTPVTIQLSGGNFSRVQFLGLYDGRWNDLGTDTNGADGWSTSWNVGTTNQTVRLTTWAWDTGGNLIMDPGGYVDVSLNLPTPHITSPQNGQTITSTPVTIQLSGGNFSKVQFLGLYDGRWNDLGTDTNGADGWSTSWNWNGVGSQPVTLTTWAWDTNNNLIMDPGGHVNVTLQAPQ